MTGHTPNYSLPYPQLSDIPDGATEMENLASAADANIAAAIAAAIADDTAAWQAVFHDFLRNFVGYNSVGTLETTTNTAYVDLATVGPTVTLTSVGTVAWIFMTCFAFNTTETNGAFMSVTTSGATTNAASDGKALIQQAGTAGSGVRATLLQTLTINPGSNTFTAKYRTVGGTASFRDRNMVVLAP